MRLRGGERILVRIPSWLGDTVMALPALQALSDWQEEQDRGGELTLAGPAALVGLVESSLPRARALPIEPEGRAAWRKWRDHDVALLLTGSFRSAWMAFRAGIPERVGWSRDGRSPLLTTGVTPARERGETPLHLGQRGRFRRWLPRHFGASCVELVGHIGVAVRETRPRLAPTDRARESVTARLAAAGLTGDEPFLVINAGGRADSAKAVPNALWIEAAREIRRQAEVAVVVVAGPGEEARAEECGAGIPGSIALTRPVLDLFEELALLERAALLLTGDMGPRHLAVACGAKQVVVFGSTDPRHTADFLGETRAVRRVVPCGPCHRGRCPLEGTDALSCLTGVDPKAIASAVLSESAHPSPLTPDPSH